MDPRARAGTLPARPHPVRGARRRRGVRHRSAWLRSGLAALALMLVPAPGTAPEPAQEPAPVRPRPNTEKVRAFEARMRSPEEILAAEKELERLLDSWRERDF